MDADLSDFIETHRPLAERELEALLPGGDAVPDTLRRAMRHAALSPGKRLRPLLSMMACEAVGARPDKALRFGCAVEFIHAYSLAHDDLPAMDDADLRRGRPALHKAFDEATAILAGDALLTLAFETAACAGKGEVAGRLVAELARGAGAAGMVGGQVLDLEGEGKAIGEKALETLHGLKTGALMRAALVGGGILGGGDEASLDILAAYGSLAGLAFQVADDLLDLESSAAVLGKDTGNDAAAGKATYPSLLGAEGARARARDLADRAEAEARRLEKGGLLAALARYFVERKT